MTSSNGNICCVTGPLCGKFTGHRWIPRTKASDAELWCFLLSAPDVFFYLRLNKRLSKQLWGWWFETPSHSLLRHRNEIKLPYNNSTWNRHVEILYRNVIKRNFIDQWSWKIQLEQLERLRSEDTPRRLMITHTIESYWIPSQKTTKSKLQILKIRQNFKFTRHTFWSCLIYCANMKWIRWVLLKIQSGHDSVHRRTDGQTDKVIPVYPPINFVEAGGIMM